MTLAAPVQLGSVTAAAGSTTLVLTTLADSPAASTIVVFAASAGSVAPSLVNDSAGNSYAAGVNVNSGSSKQRDFFCAAAAHLPAGGTISVTFASASAVKLMSAVSVSGLAGMDVEGGGRAGAARPPAPPQDHRRQWRPFDAERPGKRPGDGGLFVKVRGRRRA